MYRDMNSVDWHSIAFEILNVARDGIMLVDLHSNVLAVNQTLLGLLGESQSEEFTTRGITENREGKPAILSLLGYTPNEWETDCQALLRLNVTIRSQQVLVGKSHLRPLERITSLVRNPEGNPVGWLILFRDANEKLELAHIRDDELQMLVHDLRSPLAVIMGSLGTLKMLLSEGSFEHSGQLIELMLRSSDRILRLINDLLDIGRLESGTSFLKPEPIEIAPFMEEVARQVAPIAKEARIAVEVQPEPNLPVLLLDPAHLSRVLANLLDNAVKFTPDGGRIIFWARMNTDARPEKIEIGITDNGAGISMEIQKRVFEKFQQVPAMPGRRSGSGLGLYYCKLVVEAHGGQIGVQSQIGAGSTFMISFPKES